MPEPPFEFIDAHVHFYDLAHPTLRYSWLEPDFVHPVIGNIDGIKTLRYLYDNFVAETRFTGVTGAVHVQAALDSVDPVDESTFVNDQLDGAMPVMLVGDARMQSPDVEATLAGHAQHPNFRGIRDFAKGDYLVDPDFHRGYALLQKYAMSYDLDATWENLGKAGDLASRFPDTLLILGHAGFPQERSDEYRRAWQAGLADDGCGAEHGVQDLRSRDGRRTVDRRDAPSVGARLHRGVRRRPMHVRHQLAGRPLVLQLSRPGRCVSGDRCRPHRRPSSVNCSSTTPVACTGSEHEVRVQAAQAGGHGR